MYTRVVKVFDGPETGFDCIASFLLLFDENCLPARGHDDKWVRKDSRTYTDYN